MRRAWAEVRNRGLGELRFGRMGSHWGLGMLANGGSGIDSDYQSDIDRILLTTRLAGIYLFGAYDFAGEGLIYQEFADLGAIQYDQSRLDDVTQFVFGAAYRQSAEEQRETLQRGDAVLNVGAYFAYRNQALDNVTQNPLTLGTIFGRQNDFTPGDPDLEAAPVDFVQRGAEVFVPDLWVQLLYEDLRIELEAAFVVGTIRNLGFDPNDVGPFDGFNLLQFGAALELEYHVINDQLGLYFYAGLRERRLRRGGG